ncbi:F-box/kelch-repeat protein At3g23880-like [Daucus carota subsp. sativus]|uniref:F-box/kelch-repeat protein At3g23880-like n=1 Tax=Daucus carota subsp. sativus TaxID=79200 RepID=UPI003083C158
MSATSFHDLPPQTIIEILLRLPVKDLVRSTSVNKTWYSLINHPSFISSQISRSICHSHDNALLIIPPSTSLQKDCSLFSAETSSTLIEKFDIPFETKTRTLKLIAQVHGMLLITDLQTDYASRELYLWNPYVRQHRVLVSSCYKKHLDNLETTCALGMGFDKVMNDYKIVRIIYVEDDRGELLGDVAPKVEIFSLTENVWRKIKNPGVPRLDIEDGVFVDGCYYWFERNYAIVDDTSTCHGHKLRIMSFDFHSELFGEFNLPDDLSQILARNPINKLMRFEDSLALCVLDEPLNKGDSGLPYCIWLMRQENGVVTWTLRFRYVLEECGYPLAITKNGTLVIELFCSKNPGLATIVFCNQSMIHQDHGFGECVGPVEISTSVFNLSTVDTSFRESLILYEGGKSLLKYAKY